MSGHGYITPGVAVFFFIYKTALVMANEMPADTIRTPEAETPISHTTELKTLAKQWSLNQEEYQHYLDLLRGPLGKWNPSIDPLLALGMFATSPHQEQRYAELYARQEFDLTERALQFQQAYRAAFDRLYSNTATIDHRLLAPYFANEQKKSAQREGRQLARQQFIKGDRLLLFAPENCHECLSVINRLTRLLSSTQQSGVDVYIRNAQDDKAVRAWAIAHQIKTVWLKSQRLTLNRDEGLLHRLLNQSSAIAQDTMPLFLKRDGRFFQLNREGLGL